MNDNQTQNLPEPKNEIVVYQPDETIRLAVRLENETVWLTQSQLCELFQRDVSVISRHIKNIFSEGELDKESNLHYLQIATSDRPVALYSLDVIISVGYRVKSVIGTRFRQWANRILKEYVLRGYAVNERFARLEQKVLKHEEQINLVLQTALPPIQGVFYDGQLWDARALVPTLRPSTPSTRSLPCGTTRPFTTGSSSSTTRTSISSARLSRTSAESVLHS